MLGILRRAFSFTSWTIAHPNEPPPGDMLDASFDAQDQKISEIEALVADVRRSDGSLQNGVVGVDQLHPDLKAALRIPTAKSSNGDELGWKTAEAEADVWAHASKDWAENMPDTIPENSVAVMDITGDHWSARWWAHQAAISVSSKYGGIFIGDSPPPDPYHGLAWWSSTTGNLHIWYIDQDSGQWVQINTDSTGGGTVTPEMFGAVGDGVTDDSAAFTAALAASRYVTCIRKATPYLIKNVDIASGRTLDMQRAQIRPAPGANYCVRLTGANAACIDGDWVDSADNLLKTTTLTVAAAAGATSVTVASAANLYVEGLIVIACDADNGFTAGYGGPRKKVHHCLVSAIAGSVITLSEPLRFAAAGGNTVATSLGFIVSESDGCVVSNHTVTTAALFGTIRSVPGGANTGKGRWSDIEAGALTLGCVLTAGSVSSVSYQNIRGYLGYSLKPYVCGFGVKVDGSTATSTRGGHHFTRCDMLGSQEGFDVQKSEYNSYTDCGADSVAEIGIRIGNASRFVVLSGAWSQFNGKGVSVSGASSDIHIWSMTTDNRSTNAPWGQDIDLEVSDDSTLIFVSREGWRKSRLMRSGAGWNTISNITMGPDISFLEAGTVTAPGEAFRVEPGLGVYRPSSGKAAFAAGGIFAGGWTSQGMLLATGLVGTPSLYFNADPTTGIYQTSTGRIALALSGVLNTVFQSNAAIFTAPVRLPSYTVAAVPAAATAAAGALIYVSNESGGATPAFSDGTNWRRVADRAIIT